MINIFHTCITNCMSNHDMYRTIHSYLYNQALYWQNVAIQPIFNNLMWRYDLIWCALLIAFELQTRKINTYLYSDACSQLGALHKEETPMAHVPNIIMGTRYKLGLRKIDENILILINSDHENEFILSCIPLNNNKLGMPLWSRIKSIEKNFLSIVKLCSGWVSCLPQSVPLFTLINHVLQHYINLGLLSGPHKNCIWFHVKLTFRCRSFNIKIKLSSNIPPRGQ